MSDCFAEALRRLRKQSQVRAIDDEFALGAHLSAEPAYPIFSVSTNRAWSTFGEPGEIIPEKGTGLAVWARRAAQGSRRGD